MDSWFHVDTIHDQLFALGHPQGRVQRRPILGHVHVGTGEEGIPSCLDVSATGHLAEQADRRGKDALLGEVDPQAGRVEGEGRRTSRIVGEEITQMARCDRRGMIAKCRPLRGRNHVGRGAQVHGSTLPGLTRVARREGVEEPMKSELRSGVIAGIGAYVMWGFLTVYWKTLHEFSAVELIGYRIVSSVVLLTVVLMIGRRLRPLLAALRDPRLLGRVAVAAILLTANWTSYVWAVLHDNVIETALGYFMAPLGTMLIGVVVLGEKLRVPQRVAVVLAFAAVIVLTIGYGRVPWIALVLAATWSIYGLFKKRVPLAPQESLAAETFVLLIPALALVAWGGAQPDGVPTTADTWHIVLIAISGLVTAVPLVMFAHAAQRVPFTLLGPMQYVVPTINFLLGWLVYHEELDLTRVIGFGLVWIALVVTTVDMIRYTRLAATAVVAGVLASCAAGTGDYRSEAQRFIESDDMAKEQGQSFSGAECDEPSSTDVGTTFACTADDGSGASWTFTVVVTEDQGILVSDGRPSPP